MKLVFIASVVLLICHFWYVGGAKTEWAADENAGRGVIIYIPGDHH